MGISGLLPLLRSVQKPTHLSELAGTTIAVDAYVWLHRGAYACAPELVVGKDTTRYVDYAMYRVRLLQHYNVVPYLVFDGGPLPAKQRTEVERKRKRDEHFVLANALAKRGKHAEAREHYVKCVDITPQMAFQLIKALRAENVSYIVAPYEADAQLAYLERTGIVDGILTEDSDLLIFGARRLLLKLDASTATCIAISSDTLASNASSDLALHGWSITELRACAMLSGCDYLEGVRGVGLKTAGKIMRRWGTIERALRSLRMDGKHVERDWEQRMRTAEAAFLHQRVWDPRTERIVYLTDPDMATWDAEKEQFIGRHIDSEPAIRLARGDIDPTTLEPMIDIMPSFQPSTCPRPRPLALKDPNRQISLPSTGDGTPAKGSLFHYFEAKQPKLSALTPVLSVVCPTLPTSAPAQTKHVGGMSGKRTLAEQYDREADTPTKRPRIAPNNVVHNSKFFASPPPTRPALDDDKEDLEELEDLDVASPAEAEAEADPVEQEHGYMSPSPAFSSPGGKWGSTPDFSSPLQVRHLDPGRIHRGNPTTPHRAVENFRQSASQTVEKVEADAASDDGRITSPPSGSRKMPVIPTRKPTPKVTMVTVHDLHPEQKPQDQTDDVFSGDRLSIDLRRLFAESPRSSVSGAVIMIPAEPSANIVVTRASAGAQLDDAECIEDEEISTRQAEERHRIVGAGWEKRYACTSREHGRPPPKASRGKDKPPPRPVLRRCETMYNPLPQGISVNQDHSATDRSHRRELNRAKSPEWLPPVMTSPALALRRGVPDGDMSACSSSQGAVVDDPGTLSPASRARSRLHAYRFG